MHNTIVRLIKPQSAWHIVELTANTLATETAPETADLLIINHLSAHYSDMQASLADWLAVLKPNGWLAIVDTIVPGSSLRGKKANLQRRAGVYVNELLRWRDGAHGRNLSLDEWLELLRVVNVRQPQYETHRCEIEFNSWLEPAKLPSPIYTRLRAMLKQTPEPVTAALTPHWANDRITFFLTELVLVGKLGLND